MDYAYMSRSDFNRRYINDMKPVLNKKAVFSDTTENYISPAEPNPYSRVTIRLRVASHNIDKAYLIHQDFRYEMFPAETEDPFDYLETEVEMEDEEFSYYFRLEIGKLVYVYDISGVHKHTSPEMYFRIIPGFSTPKWAKGAVMYQIYVDRFANGDIDNDVLSNEYEYIHEKTVRVTDWDKYPATMGVREFYGGDLKGVLDKMDYLSDLGIDVIYFNPLFVSPSNHKYDIQDYDYIDPHFGRLMSDHGELLREDQHENREATRYINRVTNPENLESANRMFIKVVEEAHKRGIRVILDGVFNHCGSFNKWLDGERIYENAPGYEKGAFIEKDSPYHNYFRFSNENAFPYNKTYDGWWGHDTLPKLNYENSRELFYYIMSIAAKWVSPPFNADGWRLDVAADLGYSPEYNHYFWREFRRAVRNANPQAIVIAEHYGSPRDWLNGREWDTVMNYDAFMEPVTWFLTGMQKHSDDFREDLLGNSESFIGAMSHHMADFTTPSLLIAMNELSNHDHSRFLTRTNRTVGRTNSLGPEAANKGINKAVMREAVVMQFTWPGAPTIYYGDEAGVCGWTDPDNRRTYPWGHEDKEMIAFHKEMIRIHKENRELIFGSLKYLYNDYNFLSYGRFTRDAACVILINNDEKGIHQEIKVWQLGIPKECEMKVLMFSREDGYTTLKPSLTVTGGRVAVDMPKTSAMILRYSKKEKENRGFFGIGR
ncbi:MAG: glycoside hydrolase family 13 protein [Lachnospiraceae bacterium]|nr:glycoside hydrolase family 13 protein [Lachnospiraceae bacterium]